MGAPELDIVSGGEVKISFVWYGFRFLVDSAEVIQLDVVAQYSSRGCGPVHICTFIYFV